MTGSSLFRIFSQAICNDHHTECPENVTEIHLRRHLDSHAVVVAAHAGRCGAGVGNLVSGGLIYVNSLQGHMEYGSGNLAQFGMQSLTHLHASVGDQHRAIGINVHKGSCLESSANPISGGGCSVKIELT